MDPWINLAKVAVKGCSKVIKVLKVTHTNERLQRCGDLSGDSGDKQMAALQTNIIHLHWRCCHCPVQKYHFIEGSQWILIVTRWSQDNMCWYDPKPTNKRLLQRSTSLIHRFHNWGGGCIQGKVNNSLFSLMMTLYFCTELFCQDCTL